MIKKTSFFLFFFCFCRFVFAGTLSSVEFRGLKRTDPDAVLSRCRYQKGDDLPADALGHITQDIFKTGWFADVRVSWGTGKKGKHIVVDVRENPIVHKISFEGYDKINVKVLEMASQMKPGSMFTKARVKQAVMNILDVYRSHKGMFSASVSPKMIELPENRVNVVFEVREGPVTHIRHIRFQGAHSFSSSKLKDAIYSREKCWWRFFAQDDVFDKQRFASDEEALRQFYYDRGYMDVKIRQRFAELAEDHSHFILTFVIEEGMRYKIQDIHWQSDLPRVPYEALKKKAEIKPGQWMSMKTVREEAQMLSRSLDEMGKPFWYVSPIFDKQQDTHTLLVTYHILEGDKKYVEKINISGNLRTLDRVIRREVSVSEGDALSDAKLAASENSVHDLGFFSSVEAHESAGTQSDRRIVHVKVNERSTGEIGVGAAGSSIDGLMGKLFFHDTNFLGRGEDLSCDFLLSKRRKDIDLSWTDPYFLDRPLLGGFDIFHKQRDRNRETGVKQKSFGGTFRLGYQFSDTLSQEVRYTLYRDQLSTDTSVKNQNSANESYKSGVVSSVGHTLFYDRRNRRLEPTSGYYLSLGQDLAGVGGSVHYHRHSVGYGLYHAMGESWVASLKGSIATIRGRKGQDVRITDRFFLGGPYDLRGFDFEGIGPRDTKTDKALGGHNMYRFSLELARPLPFGKDLDMKGCFFLDGGNVTGLSRKVRNNASVHHRSFLRLAAGFGVVLRAPMLGEIGVFFGRPIRKDKHDQKEPLQFRLGHMF